MIGIGILLYFGTTIFAQVLTITPQSCLSSDSAPANALLNFTNLYAQFDQGQNGIGKKANGFNWSSRPAVYEPNGLLTGIGSVLRLVLTGTTGSQQLGFSNVTNFLSAVVSTTEVLTFQQAQNQSALCSSIRNPSTVDNATSTSCPYGAGEIALGVEIPLEGSFGLTTITTHLTVLDPSVPPVQLACYMISVTPYYPSYFPYKILHYLPIFLLASYLLIYVISRFWAAHSDFVHENETHLASSLTLKLSVMDSLGDPWKMVIYSAWAGKQLVGSGSLRRFSTLELREVWNTLAWFSIVGMVAVNWPSFAYPIFVQSAWTTLIYKSNLPFVRDAPDLLSAPFSPPPNFASQISDVNSPLYLDTALPPVLLNLESSADGLTKWARVVGLDVRDLWSVSAFTFFSIIALVIVVSMLVLGMELIFEILEKRGEEESGPARVHPLAAMKDKEMIEPREPRRADGIAYEGDILDGFDDGEKDYDPGLAKNHSNLVLHLSLLQGNLVRVLGLFHLPLSIFSIYQITLHATCPKSSLVLAILTLIIVCFAIPLYLVYSIRSKSNRDLYQNLPMLLSVGPLYNVYSDECTLFSGARFAINLVLAIAIGGIQGNGTVQAAIILVVEVGDTLITSLWLPWGDNSSMGPLAFLLSISKILIAVLLIVLAPAVGVSIAAVSWLTYVVFLVQGLIVILLLFVLGFKVIELVIRMIGKVYFDESRSARVGGLFGALRRLDRAGIKKRTRGSPTSNSAVRRRFSHSNHGYGNGIPRTSSDTGGTAARLVQPRHKSRESSVHSYATSPPDTYGRGGIGSRGQLMEEEGFIMSSMSNSNWSQGNTGYIPPSAYSTVPQPLSPSLHSNNQMQLAQAQNYNPIRSQPTSSAGFTRLGGGRASSENPYEVSQSGNGVQSGLYGGSNGSRGGVGNKNRQSQSAIIESALPASTSQLFSNTAHSRYSIDLLPPPLPKPEKAKGFFGRFKGKPIDQDTEFSSDEDSEILEEAGTKKSRWSKLLRKSHNSTNSSVNLDSIPTTDPNQKSEFSVKRKPNPSPNSTTPSLPTITTEVPTLNVQPASRPSSGIAIGGNWPEAEA